MKLITLQEAMDVFGVSRATIDRWRLHKQLPFIKIGKEVFIEVEELEAWVKSYAVHSGATAGKENAAVKVAVGYQMGTAHMWTSLLMKQTGLFEEELRRFYPRRDVKIVWHNGANGLELAELMIAGKLHIASLGDYPIAICGALSRLLPSFRAALLAFDGKSVGGKGISVVVPPSGPIRSLNDLAEATLSSVAHSSAGCRLHQLIDRLGGRPAATVHRDMSDCAAAIRERRVGASVMWEPYLSVLRDSGFGKILLEDGLGADYLTGVVADDRWAADHEPVVIAYLKAHLRAHRMIRREFDTAVSAIHLATGFSAGTVERILSRVRWDAAVYARDLDTLGQLHSPDAYTDARGVRLRLHYLQSALDQLRLPPLPDEPLQGEWSPEITY